MVNMKIFKWLKVESETNDKLKWGKYKHGRELI